MAVQKPPLIALIAGEDSGDQLGADLLDALRARYPGARFVGIGGRRMMARGFESWFDIRELSVMGFAEVVKHLPRLLKLRKALVQRLLNERPDVTIGIDAPDFNLGVERKLKAAGLRTVHYVSPSVWAWREKRAEKIGQSADRVLCLFPMEPPIYAKHGVDARFVGHPLADTFPMVSDRAGARRVRFRRQEDRAVAGREVEVPTVVRLPEVELACGGRARVGIGDLVIGLGGTTDESRGRQDESGEQRVQVTHDGCALLQGVSQCRTSQLSEITRTSPPSSCAIETPVASEQLEFQS